MWRVKQLIVRNLCYCVQAIYPLLVAINNVLCLYVQPVK